ncbi:MAG: TlpA family protein disulfide reductase, partial [Prevotella sp.]|nr:TlpA family protein disulfide reductase [Prevotella sp.]
KEINKIAEHIYGANVNQQEQMKGMEKIEKLNVRFAQLVARTAEKNIDNEFGYFMLTYYPEEVIDNKLRTKLIAKLPANMQQRPAIKQMKAVLDRAAKTAEGANISDFSQPGLDGNEVSIMSLISQNRVTIIDFWASWCGPCRQEMPFMKELYSQLKDKGLGIVGISLDSNHDAWRNGTKQLGIPWPQMSDLKGWDNAAAKQFNITSIPHTIVVDQKGKILRRGLRGETLKEYVESALK